jgi:hypothetical protein
VPLRLKTLARELSLSAVGSSGAGLQREALITVESERLPWRVRHSDAFARGSTSVTEHSTAPCSSRVESAERNRVLVRTGEKPLSGA